MTLLERDPHAPPSKVDEMPITSRYTFGPAGERFFRCIKDEARIMGTHCMNCNLTYVPAITFCERCLSELSEWVDVGTTGKIYTFTLLYETYEGKRKEDADIIAFVKIADGGLIHRIGEVKSEDIYIGMLVEAVFKPPSERSGSILDITHFRPLKT